MKFKPLPPLEELKEHFDYNPDTGIIIWKKTTKPHMKVGAEAGSLNVRPKTSYRLIQLNHSKYKAHRLAYYMYHGIDPAEKQIDHIDGNGLNNKINNLRLATHSDNGKNRNLNKNNTSGVTGVIWGKQRGRWRAQIKLNGKFKFLGHYSNIQDAIQARKEGEKKYFGKFRRLD